MHTKTLCLLMLVITEKRETVLFFLVRRWGIRYIRETYYQMMNFFLILNSAVGDEAIQLQRHLIKPSNKLSARDNRRKTIYN